jgi:protein-tyrosine phosphatase
VFSIFRKKYPKSGALERLSCDMHSHLIPGIDDGVPDLSTSLQLIRGLIDLGYRKIITTPHINGDIFANTPEVINGGLDAVRAGLSRESIGVPVGAAAEYLMDDVFVRRLEKGESLLRLQDNMVLVELSFIVPAINLMEILFQLQLEGYQPVLAHPERYLYFSANKGWYEQLRNAGCLFQLNLLSFSGYYGPQTRDVANYLVKKGYVEYLGTDLHHSKQLEQLRTSPAVSRTADKLIDAGLIRNMSL